MSNYLEFGDEEVEIDTEREFDLKQLPGFSYSIDKTWDGSPVNHEPFTFEMKWLFQKIPGRPHKRVISVEFEGPLFDDPEPEEPPGITPGLWNHEVVEFFFANDRDQYLEIEVGPHGHWLCLLFDGIRKPFNNGEELELVVSNKIVGFDKWKCRLEIPLAYFPGNVTHFNSYAIHGVGKDRVYEALHPVTDGTYAEPDFHRLQFFKRFNRSKIIPDGYGHRPFADFKYGDLWEGKA